MAVAFEDNTIDYIKFYVEEHMADWEWYQLQFYFITGATLYDRLAD